MRPMKSTRKNARVNKGNGAVTLKAVAEKVGLTPGTVSAVLNNSPACRSVPERTKTRILEAARELNYRPNFLARALRVKRTYTIGVIAAEIGDSYGSVVISGIERYLRQRNYFYLTVAHRHETKLLESYAQLLLERGIEGVITVDTSINQPLPLPTVAIAGHRPVDGVTNIVLDHRRAAQLALQHLATLGHTEIAFMKGPAASADAVDRWDSICLAAREFGIEIRPELTLQLKGQAASDPVSTYPFVQQFLSRSPRFTALFAYNDNSAIGAIHVMQDAGLRVPRDVSVVGFDDIQAAAYTYPSLTTIRQPLQKMGEIAASTLLDRIETRCEYVPEIAVVPELIVRQSSGPALSQDSPPVREDSSITSLPLE
jgi:DNA-binding LacI/PurR family transcriptional regulator